MGWIAAALFALALLVLGAGVAKLARPAAVLDALWRAKLPWRSRLTRSGVVTVLAVVEIGVGAWCLAFGTSAAALLLALLYAGFSAFAARLLRVNGPSASCGCFGASQAPVSVLHVGITLAATALAALAAADPPGGVDRVLARQPAWGVPFAVAVVVVAVLLEQLLTRVPARLHARTRSGEPRPHGTG